MALDFNALFKDVTENAISSLEKDGMKIADQTTKLLSVHKEAIKQISDYVLNGELTVEEAKSEIEDELKTFQSEMLAAKVAGKAAIQKAINAVSESIIKAVSAYMPNL
jgi:polyhydroxyalkanoate synthesis regulator phasin